jgi:hypothetical protein
MEAAAIPQSVSPDISVAEKLTFVCWRWRPQQGYRSKFSAETVNVLYSMLKRHYLAPFELVCVTDDPTPEIRREVRVIKLWSDYANVPSPHGRLNPSCYRRLKMYARGAGKMFGPRICSIDLDVVIVRDITRLFDLSVEFKMYGDTARGTPYNGSLQYFRADARPQLWEKFDPMTSPALGLRLKYIGSDQAWIGACLGPNEAKFTKADGVYSYRNQIQNAPWSGRLPPDARIVVFHGHADPWCPHVQRKLKWVAEHYR